MNPTCLPSVNITLNIHDKVTLRMGDPLGNLFCNLFLPARDALDSVKIIFGLFYCLLPNNIQVKYGNRTLSQV